MNVKELNSKITMDVIGRYSSDQGVSAVNLVWWLLNGMTYNQLLELWHHGLSSENQAKYPLEKVHEAIDNNPTVYSEILQVVTEFITPKQSVEEKAETPTT